MMTSDVPLRVAIVGTARRSSYMYGPILQSLAGQVELVAVWGRSTASARRLGEELDAPWYTDLDLLMRENSPAIGIVSVAYAANGKVGLMAVEHGLHVLLETPIAHDLGEADAIIAAAEQAQADCLWSVREGSRVTQRLRGPWLSRHQRPAQLHRF